MAKRFLGFCALLLLSAGANAGIVIDLVSKTANANQFDWTYAVTLERDTLMAQNDFFVIYGIPGINNALWTPNTSDSHGQTGVPGPADWQVSEPLSGPVPSFLAPNDKPNIPNVEISLLADTTIQARNVAFDPNGLLLGTLTVTTPFGQNGIIDYTSISTQLSGSDLNVVHSVTGPIPEPSTVGMMGAGLLAVVAFALRKRR